MHCEEEDERGMSRKRNTPEARMNGESWEEDADHRGEGRQGGGEGGTMYISGRSLNREVR